MPLPEPCEKCAEYGGYWVEYPNGGMGRCKCPRGLALREMERLAKIPPVARPPVIPSELGELYAEMICGVYGYALHQAAPLIAAEICAMCESKEQAMEFVRRFTRAYPKWPGGLGELRWAFCQMGFKPLDAVAPPDYSEIYPDGLPEAAGARPPASPVALRDPRSRELPPGEAGIVLRAVIEKSRRL